MDGDGSSIASWDSGDILSWERRGCWLFYIARIVISLRFHGDTWGIEARREVGCIFVILSAVTFFCPRKRFGGSFKVPSRKRETKH